MASNPIERIALAATLSICVQTQLVLPTGSYAQGVQPDIPGSSGAVVESPTSTASIPAPIVPDVASIITPDVSALLSQTAPSPTTMVIDFAQTPSMNFSGDFVNPANVTLYAVSTDPNVTTATLNATNIYNAGIITTVLPSGGLPGYTNLASNLNLVLNAVNSIINIGEISSSGNLSLTAGTAICNVQTTGSGTAAMLSAANNIYLNAGSIVNSGAVIAASNINISTAIAGNLAINATNGLLRAGDGINIRDASFVAKHNLDVLGGVWDSPILNIHSGIGICRLALTQFVGELSGSTGEAYISSSSNLRIGSLSILGDPVFHSDGDLTIPSMTTEDSIQGSAGGNLFAGSLNSVKGHVSLFASGNVLVSGALSAGTDISVEGTNVIASNVAMLANESITILSSSSGGTTEVGGSLLSAASIAIQGGLVNANGTKATSDSLFVRGFDGISMDNATLTAKDTQILCTGAGSVSLNMTAITTDTRSIVSAQTGNISAQSLQLTGSNQVSFDALHGSVDLTDSMIRSGGGNVFIYGEDDVVLGMLLDSSSESGAGRIYVAAVNGSVTASSESSITGGSVPSPQPPPPGFADISINAGHSVSVGDVTAGGGTVDIMAGALITRSGFSVTASPSYEGPGAINVRDVNTSGPDSGRGLIFLNGAEGGIVARNISGNGTSVSLYSAGELSVESIQNNVTDARTTYNTIDIYAEADSELVVRNVSASGINVGGLVQVNNNGTGVLHVENLISVQATEQGSGGTIFLTSSGQIKVDTDLVADGKTNGTNGGAGGVIELVSFEGDVEVQGRISANGVGEGMSGGRIRLTAFAGNLSVQGSEITANGADGDGGGVTAGAFGTVALPAISANGGGSAGHGGSVLVSADNFEPTNLVLSARGSGSGAGGRVSILSELSFDAQSGVSISAQGGTSGNGGSVRLSSGHNLQADSSKWNISAGLNGNGGTVLLQSGRSGETSTLSVFGAIHVDGNGTGNGGSIEIEALGADSGFSVGTGADAALLFARGGSLGGNGGAISLTSGGSLSVESSQLHVDVRGASGDGGILSLRSGTAGGGGVGTFSLSGGGSSLDVVGNLNASGKGQGNGGSITLSGGAGGGGGGGTTIMSFSIASSSSVNVQGDLIADAGVFGRGGTVVVTAQGAGAGISVGSELEPANMRVRGGSEEGAGGSVTIQASGSVQFGGTLILAQARNEGDGGSVQLSGESLTFPGNHLLINASGYEVGNGGLVSLSSYGAESDLVVGQGSGNVTILANGGSPNSAAGSAGSISVESGRELVVETANMRAAAMGTVGNGGTISLTAATSGTGSLSVFGDIVANGAGTGDGGRVFITQGGPGNVTLGKEGTISNILARSGAAGGAGGEVSIQSGGSVTANSTNIRVEPLVSGNGGTIRINAGLERLAELVFRGEVDADAKLIGDGGTIELVNHSEGLLHIDGKHFTARGGETSGNGNTIRFQAGFINFENKPNLDVSARGKNSNGGQIELVSSTAITISSGSLKANAGESGDGGTIRLLGNSVLADITLSGDTTVAAHGGRLSGDGGTIVATSARSVSVTGVDLDVRPTGPNGKGGNIFLRAATANLGGQLTVAGDLRGDGRGSGSGGTILIDAGLTGIVSLISPLILANGGNGVLEGQPQTGGNGGDITISGAVVSAQVSALISASGGGVSGNGGTVTVLASSGLMRITGEIQASGAGTGDGGTIQIDAPITGIIVANGASISRVTATGGALGGDGGSVTITAGLGLAVEGASIDVSTGPAGGKAGTIKLESGLSGEGILKIFGRLRADGTGLASGGMVEIVAHGTVPLVPLLIGTQAGSTPLPSIESISAKSGSAGGDGGTIRVVSGGGLSVVGGRLEASPGGGIVPGASDPDQSAPILDVRGVGNGGKIILEAGQEGPGALLVSGVALNADAGISGTGGEIRLISHDATSNVDLRGFVDPTGDVLAEGPGLYARGGLTGGNGGLVAIQSAQDILVDGSKISVNARAVTGGNGGNIELTAGTAGSGQLRISGTLNADGRGPGNGGTVRLSYNSSNALSIGSSDPAQASGSIVARAPGAGAGGSIIFQNGSSDLTVIVNSKLDVSSKSGDDGTLSFNANEHAVDVSGGGLLLGKVDANGSKVKFELSGTGAVLTANSIETSSGFVILKTTRENSRIDVLSKADDFSIKSFSDVTIDSQGEINIGVEHGKQNANGGKAILGTGITLIARDGDIRLGALSQATQDDIFLSVAGNGDVKQFVSGATTLKAADLVEFSITSGEIGTKISPVILLAPRLAVTQQAGGASFLQSPSDERNDLQLSQLNVTGNFTLKNRGGLTIGDSVREIVSPKNLTFITDLGSLGVFSEVSAKNVTLQTFGSGDVNLHNRIQASGKVVIETDSATGADGKIVRHTANEIKAETVSLKTTAGEIGRLFFPLAVNAPKISVIASQGNVFISLGEDTKVESMELGDGNLELSSIRTITSTKALVVPNGSITLKGSLLGSFGTGSSRLAIQTRELNVEFAKQSHFNAFAVNSDPLSLFVEQPLEQGFSLRLDQGLLQVKTSVIAKNGNVQLYVLDPAGQIDLGFSTRLSASGGVAVGVGVVSRNGTVEYEKGIHTSVSGARVEVAGSGRTYMPEALMGLEGSFKITSDSSVVLNAGPRANAGPRIYGSFVGIESGATFTPIGLVETSTKLRRYQGDCATVFWKRASFGLLESNHFLLDDGTCMFACDKNTTVEIRTATIHAKGGAKFIIVSNNSGFVVLNLADKAKSSVVITIGEKILNLAPGQGFQVSDKSSSELAKIATSPVRSFQQGERLAILFAYSLSSALINDDVLASVRNSAHRSVLESVFKMYACLDHLNSRKEIFVCSEKRK